MIVVTVARKPIAEANVAANVLKHATGALAIDATRIAAPVGEVIGPGSFSDPTKRAGEVGTDLGFTGNNVAEFQRAQADSVERANRMGRWPANLVLGHTNTCTSSCTHGCPVSALDVETAGLQPSKGAYVRKHGDAQFLGSGLGDGRVDAPTGLIDAGGASRFFKQVGGRRS